jgi:small subunit ribosomal protein S1
MSKERIRPENFCHVDNAFVAFNDAELVIDTNEQKEIEKLYAHAFSQLAQGKPTIGKIIKIDSDGVLVDINYKSYGLIPKYEFTEHELKTFKNDQKIEVLVDQLEDINGTVVLSYEKAKALRAWDEIVKLHQEEKPIEGLVTHKVKGGLSVDIGINAFLPGSQIDLQRVMDFDKYVGQKITAYILKINQKRGNVILSRRKYLSEQRAGERQKVLDTLAAGQVLQGVVKNITNYGAFIDIGGLDGLLHITDMTWGRIAHPSELVKVSDTITVKVLSFDKDSEKISLGIKQLDGNPWEDAEKKLEVGKKITGKIASIADYGLFVEVAPNIEGLVHISEISWTDRITDLASRYKVSDKVDVLLVSFDKENRRMSLSIKRLANNPWEEIESQFKVEQKIKGKINNITDFGIFVEVTPGIDGLVHVSDLSWTEHIDHPRDIYSIGQEVETSILSIDKDKKKISLGIKQLQKDPWEEVDTLYPINKTVSGTVVKIANFGTFIKLDSGIEALVHNSTLLEETGKKPNDEFKIGETRDFRVISVNKTDHKIALSTDLDKTSTRASSKSTKREKSSSTKEQQTFTSTSSGKTKSAFQLALESALAQKDTNDKK